MLKRWRLFTAGILGAAMILWSIVGPSFDQYKPVLLQDLNLSSTKNTVAPSSLARQMDSKPVKISGYLRKNTAGSVILSWFPNFDEVHTIGIECLGGDFPIGYSSQYVVVEGTFHVKNNAPGYATNVPYSILVDNTFIGQPPDPLADARLIVFDIGLFTMLAWTFYAIRAIVCACSRRRNPWACQTCGYDLRASVGRCPECGSACQE